MEIVHDGWLLKSPPPKRLWRAKWRNRWFVLRSGDLPGQYFLEYYTDDSCKKLKGKIDLDQCEQVDAGITFAHRKFEYKFMFDIKTPKRIYYLCAETEEAMNRWVDCVCQVCGLKVMSQDDLADSLVPMTLPASSQPLSGNHAHRLIDLPPGVDSPPPSAASTVSGPYIPISECITGKKASAPSGALPTHFPFSSNDGGSHPQSAYPSANSHSGVPTEMAPPAPKMKPRESYDVPRPLQSGNPGDLSAVGGRVEVFQKALDDRVKLIMTSADPESPPPFVAPPRPPKPPYLAEAVQQDYMNLVSIVKANVRRNSSSEKGDPFTLTPLENGVATPTPSSTPQSSSVPKETVSDEVYDFPRSHQTELVGPPGSSSSSSNGERRRHCYTNSAPGCAGPAGGFQIFTYESEAVGSNQASGGGPTLPSQPPIVHRGLKPKKPSEGSSSFSTADLSPPLSGGTVGGGTQSSSSHPIPPPPSSAPPIIDRNLKPHKKTSEPSSASGAAATPFILDPAPLGGSRQRKLRAAPSPTPISNRAGDNHTDSDQESSLSSPHSRRDSLHDEQIFFPLQMVQRRSSHEIQYLDLDLEATSLHHLSVAPSSTAGGSPKTPLGGVGADAAVVYKKVDFIKTEAFNKMRQNVEEGYRTGKTSSS